MPDVIDVIKGLQEVQHFIKVENMPAHTLKAKLVIDDTIALLRAQELRYTPREVRNALMEYGQHDTNIKLGEVIKYDPVQVEDILTKAREVTKPIIPHMVDWGIYECPKCKTRVDKTYKFCKCCGQAVKWGA